MGQDLLSDSETGVPAGGWDFFVSYTQPDRGWAEWIAWVLEEAGHSVVIQAWDFVPGGNWIAQMQTAARDARRTVAVLSEDYLKSDFGSAEWQAAMAADPDGSDRKLLVVRVADCARPGLLASRVSADLFGISEADARRRLLDAVATAMAGRAKPLVAPAFPAASRGARCEPDFPGDVSAPERAAARTATTRQLGDQTEVSARASERQASRSTGQQVVVGDVPREPPCYRVRSELLEVLYSPPGVSSAAVVHALTGMRGVGKTQVAAAYARARINDAWRLVAWIHAKELSSIVAELGSVATELGLGLGPDQGAAVRHWLERDGDRCLIVFDNADDPDRLRPFLPVAGSAHILVTSTHQSMGLLGTHVTVSEFSLDEAEAYLTERTGLADLEGARSLATELGCLPVALAQAAAVIAEQRLEYDTYLARLRDTPVEQLLGRVEADYYPVGLPAAVLMSLRSVRSRDETGVSGVIMDLLSVLSSTGVSRQLLHLAGQQAILSRHERLVGPGEVDAALGALNRASMLTFNIDGRGLSAHRLVRRVIRDELAQEHRLEAVSAAAATVLEALCEPTWEQRLDRAAVNDLIEQIAGLYEHSGAADGKSSENLTARLLDLRMWALSLMISLGDTAAQAVLIGEPLLADAKHLFGPDHFKTLNTSNDLATAYRLSGQIDKAISLQERIVDSGQRTLGVDDLHTLGYQSNLANAYQDAGRTEQAIALHEHVLAARERLLGNDDPDTLTSRGNLGASYQVAGRIREGLDLHRQVLAVRERVLGHCHPDTLTSRNNLANAYRDAGRLYEVVPMMEDVLRDHEQSLGIDHPETLATRTNLANALLDAGRSDDAIQLHQRTLADSELVLGPLHPITLAARASLANDLKETGQATEAIPLYEEALTGQEQILGPAHPHTMTTLSNLAIAYMRAGREQDGILWVPKTYATRRYS